ncbi:phosphohistidine phosphatase SixA [Pseudomonas koreensis]|jgi:phosphohistidine phosphatase|uniref:Phosphohistidine phosphatase SixA n=1 Tax=Pseudomonas fluorescens TaxID=294 RepID=A0A854XAP8_PSEFL|nr:MULTISPECIES: phosphohistidine phosphatase SixA [Pseudomonas]KAA8744950.1 phosphohistidine phosphatase SixA [Pseudomonas koreensis]MBB6156625.1 phosphohistidine phosphatase [Pseudomonas sp. JAI115]PCM48077.1 phosphohistidine phosphatase SixA [Pseudomonas fluorescens]POA23666.1 phosphohistidine phosphatase SixA [Pseudomonas sp. FW305-3-2-15-E-TSA4]POA41695.1 phosphohistidine phosphatase SixA [Pseudomonas sp. FW305-3-2-15-E-TSA2]
MKLWVLRHGEAVPYGSCPDSERALTEHGRKEALSSAAQLIGQPLTAIYASPYLRAQQTAQIVREALGFEPEIRTVDWLKPESDPDKVTDQLVSVSNVLLVSHNPLVGNLLSYLQHGAGHPPEKVGTAGLAELESPELLIGSMTLNSLKHP